MFGQFFRPQHHHFVVRAFQRHAKLGGAGFSINRQVLGRLQIQRDTGDFAGALAQAVDGGLLAGGARFFQIDQHAPGVQHGVVGRVDADERRQVFNIRVFQNGLGSGLLQLGHAGVGDRLRGLHAGLQLACVLRRKQAFGNDHIQQHSQCQRGQGDQQRQALVSEHPVQAVVVTCHHAAEEPLKCAFAGPFTGTGWFLFQPASRHHGNERQRHHG